MSSSTNSLNYLFLKRFIHLLHIFVPLSRHSLNVHINYNERFYSHPLIFILPIILTEIGLQFVTYYKFLLTPQFTVQLSKLFNERDFSIFRWLVIRVFIYVIIETFLKSFSKFLSSILYIKWRTKLVIYLHSFYFSQQRYYHVLNTTQQNQNHDNDDNYDRNYIPMNNLQSIDNPDQRITQDTDSLCRTLSIIIPLLVVSPFTIIFYIYRTWQITGYYGPLGVLIYFILWTGINKIFISYVSRTIFQQNIFEGTFRFLHIQIRTYNESIAFYNGGLFEHIRFNNYFKNILSSILYTRVKREFFLNISTNLYDYIGSQLTYLLLALAIFVLHMYDNLTNSERIAKIGETTIITGNLIYCFNQLNGLTDELTLIAANTHRIQSFIEYMKNIDTTWSEKQLNKIIEQNEILIINNLSYSTPNNNKHILLKNLNLILNEGQRLLITGDSGAGKTSLFRVLHSIWPVNIDGSFSYKSNHAYLLPQRPYFTNRSLYDELSYPDNKSLPTIEREKQIEQFLIEWNLSHIINCVESSIYKCPKYAWQDLLSPGELQCLSFLRLLFRLSSDKHPRINLIFLDEITSSVDRTMEMKMYNYLIEQNIALISIGHRQTLRQYHQIELQLQENGNYILKIFKYLINRLVQLHVFRRIEIQKMSSCKQNI